MKVLGKIVVLSGCYCSSHALGDYFERVAPKAVYRVVTREGLFNSPQEAFLDYQKSIAANPLTNRSVPGAGKLTVFNLRPSPEASTYNGAVGGYWWDWNVDHGNYAISGTTGSISIQLHCPRSDNPEPWAYFSQRVSERTSVAWCERKFSLKGDPPSKNCPAIPKPVYGETGVKRQAEGDYGHAGAVLQHARIWRSDAKRFLGWETP